MPVSHHSSLAIRLRGELPPTPPLPSLAQTLACRWAPLGFFERCRDLYGTSFTLYPLDLPPVVLLSDAQDIREMLAAPASVLHPGAGGQALTPIVGQSSFMLHDEEQHADGRRAIMPAFSRGAAEAHAEIAAEIAAQEVGMWPTDVPVALHPHLRRLTLRVILHVVFGQDSSELRLLGERILDMLDVTVSFVLVEPRLRRLPHWHATWRRFLRDRAEVDTLIARLIRRARRSSARRGDVLEALLATRLPDGSAMSDRQLRDNIVSVVLAGHETTASQLAWAFQLVAQTPRVNRRITDELDAGSDDSYLLATIAEVLRHRPVFLFSIPRAVIEPIEIGGWLYRPPAQLLGCIYLLQHDPIAYRDPHLFEPERFLQDGPDPRAWLPWGGGRKRCPGNRLASIEMSTVLREVLSRRDLHPASERLERASWRSVIVTPSQGARVILRARRSSARPRASALANQSVRVSVT
jgi:cytochrome P450